MDNNKIIKYLNQIDDITLKPEEFLSYELKEAEKIKILTRNLYNFSKKKERLKKKKSDALEALVIAGLDEEQIWQQVELQNNVIFDALVKDVAIIIAKKDELKFPLINNKTINKNNTKNEKKNILKQSEEKADKNEYNNLNSKEKSNLKLNKIKNNKNVSVKSSVVDDKFFKLHEMEKFLEKIEKEEEEDNVSTDEEDINYFEDESLQSNENSFYQIHYKDFFDQPFEHNNDSATVFLENKSKKEDSNKNKNCKSFLTENNTEVGGKNELKNERDNSDDNGISSGDDDDDDNGVSSGNDDDDDDDDDGGGGNEGNSINNNDDEGGSSSNDDDEKDNNYDEQENYKKIFKNKSNEDKNEIYDDKTNNKASTFENRQKMLKSRINALEEEALKKKPWQLMGEVTGKNRPQNSLLQEYVEFDVASRPPPILTEKSTLKLEDIIIQRIKDKAWDDVQRKRKPIELEIEYKKKLVLDQEKSKLSLAQIYEKEYLKQLDTKNEVSQDKPEVESPEHQEIRVKMGKLFSKLDALSNFHFTPKQVEPEVKIISNLPAINIEEVAPLATSDATLLAPEEVKPKIKGDLMGKTERSSTDKKRERRKKKLLQKLKHKKIEAKAKLQLQKPDSKSVKHNTLSQKLLERITRSTNVTKLKENEDGKSYKSQMKFFSKLQDEKNIKNKKNIEIKNLKLGKKIKMKKAKNK